MSGLEIAAVAVVAIWLVVATVVVMLLVRQVGLLTLRADRAAEGPRLDGISVGSAVSETVAELLPAGGVRTNVLVLGATCGPCRQLVDDLATEQLSGVMVALVEGDPVSGEGVASRLPDAVVTVVGPRADAAMKAFDLQTTPFLFVVEDGVVVSKDVLRGASHLLSLMEEEYSPKLVEPPSDDGRQRLEINHVS